MESSPPPFDPLGAEIRRWLAEARRLTESDRRAADPRAPDRDMGGPGLPRADDFGHVTNDVPDRAAFRAASRPFDAARERRVLPDASVERPSERHGIYVASGWGTRARAS